MPGPIDPLPTNRKLILKKTKATTTHNNQRIRNVEDDRRNEEEAATTDNEDDHVERVPRASMSPPKLNPTTRQRAEIDFQGINEQEENSHDADSNPSFDDTHDDERENELEPCMDPATHKADDLLAATGITSWILRESGMSWNHARLIAKNYESRKAGGNKEDQPSDWKTTSTSTCNQTDPTETPTISRAT